MKNNRKKGFTIVELVIVIAVIAILAAVLIPTFSNVIDKAKDSAALSDAKNAMTADLILAEGDYANIPAEETVSAKLDSKDAYFVKVTIAKDASVVGYYTISKSAAMAAVGTATESTDYYKQVAGKFQGKYTEGVYTYGTYKFTVSTGKWEPVDNT